MHRTAFLVACTLTAALAWSGLVSRDLSDPTGNAWEENPWVTAGGSFSAVDPENRPDGVPPSAKALRIQVDFPGKRFAYWGVGPKQKELPGNPQRLTLWARRCAPNDYSGEIILAGSDKKERKFPVKLPKDPNSLAWQRTEIDIPQDIPRPITFSHISIHNWGERGRQEAYSRASEILDLRLWTDLETTPVDQRPVTLAMQYPAVGNIFYHGEQKPTLRLSIGSWLGEKRTLDITLQVRSATGETRTAKPLRLDCLDTLVQDIPLPFTEPGAYQVQTTIQGLGTNQPHTSRYIVCPRPPELTDRQKLYSPYGLNVHGGQYVGYERFARLGFVWIRDYAFNFHWMNRARGEGAYAGWPWYPKILDAARRNGLLTLPCLMGALTYRDNPKDPSANPATPTDQWRRQLALIVATFPELHAWELDNEVDCWTHEPYGNYHQTFASIIKNISPKTWTVSEGCAGIAVRRTREQVLAGYYDHIDVVNGHRYCGVDAPEYSKFNANTGQGEARQELTRDTFRNWKRAATADGKDRQLWITEWGWDTRAGQIVTEWEQAAYLQRGWLLACANGIDKIFWYWFYDSDTDKPQNFFDGCGIYDRFRDPKPVAAAFAALRWFLPADMVSVGYVNFSPNAMAQVYRLKDGRLVAAAFKVHKDGADYTLQQPKAEGVYDMFGGRVADGGKRKLDIAPTWYVGLDPKTEWLAQTGMDVLSDLFTRAVAGEPMSVRVSNDGEYAIRTPDGWKTERVAGGFEVTPPAGTPRGDATLMVTGRKGKTEKRMPIEVDVVPEAFAQSTAADPVDGGFSVSYVNQSYTTRTHCVKAELPKGWKVEPETVKVCLASDAKTNLSFRLVSSVPLERMRPGESPKLAIFNEQGVRIDTVPVIPRDYTIRRLEKFQADGNLGEWREAHRLPSWMVGPNGEKEGSKIWMGWTKEGLAIAVDVANSRCFSSDPRSFWRATDCLELLFNGKGFGANGDKDWTPSHHQLWFCPQASAQRVYAGYWSRRKDQQTEYDLPDVRGFTLKGEQGYRMELLVPWSRLKGFSPKSGAKCGLSLALKILGAKAERSIFWPEAKSEKMLTCPWFWGRVTLE